MRARSLVHYWLYGFRGFVVMTISLAIAFSVAVTGPPTDRELTLVTVELSKIASRLERELGDAATQICPSLPPEAQVYCGAPPPVDAPPDQARPSSPPIEPAPPPAELAANETPASVQPSRAAETQLLGAPRAPRPRVERTQPQRRAATHRSERRVAARSQPQRQTQRAQPPPAPAVVVEARVAEPAQPAPAILEMLPEPPPVVREGSDAPPEDSEVGYRDDEEQRAREWRERRLFYERLFEPPPDAYEDEEPSYQNDDPPQEEEGWYTN